MRPQGEVRQALCAAAARLFPERGACTYLDLADAAQVELDAAQTTVRNMARAGELQRVGHEKRAGGGWIGLYEPAVPTEGDPFAPLAFVLAQWRRRPAPEPC